MRATQSHTTTSISNSNGYSTVPSRWLSEQCHKRGMIFVIPIQDGTDENDARQRLHLAATRHSGCIRHKVVIGLRPFVRPRIPLAGDRGRDTTYRGTPSRPGGFHPEPLTDPDMKLSPHPARATPRKPCRASAKTGVPPVSR